MKLLRVLPLFILAATLAFTGCKPKDADIKASVEKNLQANPSTAAVMVMVTDGVATLSGEVADPAAQAAAETAAKDAKGVKSVVNNTTVTAPPAPAAPVTITADDPLTSAVRDATKDHPTVTATVADGVITVNGSIEKAKWTALKAALDALNPRRVDAKGLTVN
jgi:hyperosmotically inducible protein